VRAQRTWSQCAVAGCPKPRSSRCSLGSTMATSGNRMPAQSS
jgi:hypothetical protein